MTSRLWLPVNMEHIDTSSVYIPESQWAAMQRREFLVGVCKCGHNWLMHDHFGNPNRPGTSCDRLCGCRQYRLRRVRSLKAGKTLPHRVRGGR